MVTLELGVKHVLMHGTYMGSHECTLGALGSTPLCVAVLVLMCAEHCAQLMVCASCDVPAL